MVHIINQPYEKKYVYSLMSSTFIVRLMLVVLTVVAPFFIVYNSGSNYLDHYKFSFIGFYQNSKTTVIDLSHVILKPTYQYYLKLATS